MTDKSPAIEVSAEARALLASALAKGAAEYIRIRVGRG